MPGAGWTSNEPKAWSILDCGSDGLRAIHDDDGHHLTKAIAIITAMQPG